MELLAPCTLALDSDLEFWLFPKPVALQMLKISVYPITYTFGQGKESSCLSRKYDPYLGSEFGLLSPFLTMITVVEPISMSTVQAVLV